MESYYSLSLSCFSLISLNFLVFLKNQKIDTFFKGNKEKLVGYEGCLKRFGKRPKKKKLMR